MIDLKLLPSRLPALAGIERATGKHKVTRQRYFSAVLEYRPVARFNKGHFAQNKGLSVAELKMSLGFRSPGRDRR